MAFKDEFISRDPQLRSEGPAPAADMRQGQRARVAQQATPLGSPLADYGVRSVYDSRPVSGGDFTILLPAVILSEATPAPQVVTVPAGYVMVLREVETWAENPIPFLVTRDQISIAIVRNNADVQYNTGIAVGTATDHPVKCFVIADEGQTLGVRVINQAGTPGSDFRAQLYGNLLLKTGRPAQFEIANYAGGTQMPPGSPASIAPR